MYPRAKVMNQTMIDQYLMYGMLDLAQHRAGEYLLGETGARSRHADNEQRLLVLSVSMGQFVHGCLAKGGDQALDSSLVRPRVKRCVG